MDFNVKFITDLFLDDSVTTINKSIVAAANVAYENTENISFINELLAKEYGNRSFGQWRRSLYDKKLKQKGNYYEHVVKHFTNYDYLTIYKLHSDTIKGLINFLKDFIASESSIVSIDKQVHVFLYILTNDVSFNEAGEKFGIQVSSVNYIFYEIITILYEQRYSFINWPSTDQQYVTKMKVCNRFGFPNCVGFIDSCRLIVENKRQKKTDVILLQAVCNETYMLMDVYVGDIGISKKNRVYKDSHLSKELKKYIGFESHLLADSEFKLKKNLVTPYSNIGLLTSEEIKFNEIHWNAHTYIGHAFQMLKSRFTILNHMHICRSDTIRTLIYATCVLHNFILLHEASSQLKEENNLNNYSITIDTNIVKTAQEKRQFLCNYINFIDNT